jgi:hypothetical protein
MPPRLEQALLYTITALLAAGAIYFYGWIW